MKSIIEWLFGVPPGDLAGARDWHVRLVADYGRYGDYVKLGMIVAFVALIALVIRTYRREGEARPRAKGVLAALRITVIALVFVILLRPTIALQFARTLHKSLVVLIDDSLSMSYADRYSDAGRAERLAEFLATEPSAVTELTRTRILRKALLRDTVLRRFNEDHPLILMRFSTNQPGKEQYTRALIEPIGILPADDSGDDASRLDALLGEAMGRLSASGFHTDLPGALRGAIRSVQGQRIAGIVLLSDGRMTCENAAARLKSALEYASAQPTPMSLYTVMLGDPAPPTDLAVTSLRAPREVRVGSQVRLTAYLTQRGLDGRTVELRLLCRPVNGDEWVDTGAGKSVTFPAADRETTSRGVRAVVMSLKPDRIGEFMYKAVVAARADERNTQDNSAEAPVKVSDSKVNILLVSSGAGWEFQYLRNFLLRQPELYRVSVWQQSADTTINQAASSGMKLSRLPRSLEELNGSEGGKPHPGYDVVILYDPMPTEEGFDEKFVRLLKTFVKDNGGGLCYIAGARNTENNLRISSIRDDLGDLLPVFLAPNRFDPSEKIGERRPRPWPVSLTSYGKDHPVMRLGTTSEDSEGVWRILPGIFWSHAVEKPKPAARVLAESSNPMYRTADNRPEPLVVVQPYGKGLVLYVGTDASWRWRLVGDGYYYGRFWSNVVRFLATLKARRVVVTTGGDRFSIGEKINVEAEVFDKEFEPLKEKTFELTVSEAGTDRKRKIVLTAQENRPGYYKATMLAEHTGTFELTDPTRPAETVASKRIIIELPQAEADRPEADEATMRTIASRGDYFMNVCDIDRLAKVIPPGRVTVIDERNWELWDSKFALLLIALLLVIEWVIRKKYNMT